MISLAMGAHASCDQIDRGACAPAAIHLHTNDPSFPVRNAGDNRHNWVDHRLRQERCLQTSR
jgi:hypothetical protein